LSRFVPQDAARTFRRHWRKTRLSYGKLFSPHLRQLEIA